MTGSSDYMDASQSAIQTPWELTQEWAAAVPGALNTGKEWLSDFADRNPKIAAWTAFGLAVMMGGPILSAMMRRGLRFFNADEGFLGNIVTPMAALGLAFVVGQHLFSATANKGADVRMAMAEQEGTDRRMAFARAAEANRDIDRQSGMAAPAPSDAPPAVKAAASPPAARTQAPLGPIIPQ